MRASFAAAMSWLATVLLALCLSLTAAHAVLPDEVLNDPELERRARAISLDLRCMVCQNQSIDDSDAPLARDLRVLVRERLVEGDSDAEVFDYLVSRYGEFVLLRPRLTASTVALWGSPLIVLILGIGAVVLFLRRGEPVPAGGARLSEAEKAELDALLKRRSRER